MEIPLLLLIGMTLGTLGKVLLGVAVIRVHSRLSKEHSVDDAVVQEIKKERQLSIWAVVMMLLGYVLEIVFYAGGGF